MPKTVIVQIESFAADFLQRHYAARPRLAQAPFAAQMRSLLASGYSGGHNVVPSMNPSRWQPHYLVPNAAAAQAQWLLENGETGSATPAEILARQIEALAPDVVYLSDIPVFDFALLDRLPKRPVVVGWHATYLDPRMAWPQIDLLLSGITRLRERALALGVRAVAHHMPAAPAYAAAGLVDTAGADFVFSGSFYGGIHQARVQQYRTFSRHVGQRWLDIHTPNGFATEPGERIAFHAPVYGSDVLALYARSRVVLDARGEFNLGDHAELRETSNMRLFEATRAGALLLTEHAANLAACFDIGREIETFASTDELIDKARFYADAANEPARARIAAAGHARVMHEHLIEHRAVAFERLLDAHFDLTSRPRATAGRHVVATSVDAGSALFGMAAVETLRRLLPDALLHVHCRDAAAHAALQDSGATLLDGAADDMPALARLLQQRHPAAARITCIDASIDLRDVTALGADPQALHLLDLGWTASDAHAKATLGRLSHAVLSIPGGMTLDLSGSADALAARAAAAGVPVRPLAAAAPWNPAADAPAFVFFLLRLKAAATWEFMPLGSPEQWAGCYQRDVLPYLQRVADVLRRRPQLAALGDQQTPLSASPLASHVFRREQLAKAGYRLLTARDYAAVESDPQGWDSSAVAHTQHAAFQHLIGEWQAGRRRQDLAALATLMGRIAEPGMRVLETGCGSGYNHQFLRTALPDVPLHYAGIDLAPAMVALARDAFPDARYDVMGSEALGHADGAFDIVLNGASLMHTVDYERAIAEARRVARRYVVLHTVTVHDGDEHLYFQKNAYGGTVVEVCFSAKKLNALLAAHKLMPVLMQPSIGYDLQPVLGVATRSVSIACWCMTDADTALVPTNHYCTYFDVNYLPRGLLMMESVLRHDPGARFFVLCLDDASQAAVRRLQPAAEAVHVDALMAADPAFAACRGNRSQIEWYFTATSAFVHHLLQQHPALPRITYLDADLYFYAAPAWMHDEARGASAQIVGHRFAPGSERLEIYGKYNVGWIGFAGNDEGRRLVADYRADCIDWCYDRVEPDRFGDQKYLDRWPARYPATCVSRHLGANVGPWNLARWTRFDALGGDWYVDGERLVFFHFSGLKRNGPGDYATKEQPAGYGVYYDALYAPYLRELEASETALGGAEGLRDVRYGSW